MIYIYILVRYRECNTQRGTIDSLYIALGLTIYIGEGVKIAPNCAYVVYEWYLSNAKTTVI